MYTKTPYLYGTLSVHSFVCFYLHLVYKLETLRILNNFLTQNDTWQNEKCTDRFFARTYNYRYRVSQRYRLFWLFFTIYRLLYRGALERKWRKANKKKRSKRKKVNDWIHFRRSQMSKLIRVLGSRSSSRSCIAKSCEWHATSIRIATMLRYASRSNLPGAACRKQAWQAMPGSRNRSDLVLRRHYRESRFLAQIFGMSRNATRYVFSVHAPHLVPRTLRVVGVGIVKGTTLIHTHICICFHLPRNYFKVTTTNFREFQFLTTSRARTYTHILFLHHFINVSPDSSTFFNIVIIT